jgi:hypothetical protein
MLKENIQWANHIWAFNSRDIKLIFSIKNAKWIQSYCSCEMAKVILQCSFCSFL